MRNQDLKNEYFDTVINKGKPRENSEVENGLIDSLDGSLAFNIWCLKKEINKLIRYFKRK